MRYVKHREEQLRILSMCHVHPTSGHMGTQKKQSRILERFVWPGLTTDVNNLVGLLFVIVFIMHLVYASLLLCVT